MKKCSSSPVCGNQKCKHWSEVKPGIIWHLFYNKQCGFVERKL